MLLYFIIDIFFVVFSEMKKATKACICNQIERTYIALSSLLLNNAHLILKKTAIRGKKNQNLMRETAKRWRMTTGQVSVNSTTE